MRVTICTLGCKVNQYESQAMEQMLRDRGHTVTDSHEDADAYVINTCSVTAVSDQKSRQTIRRIRRTHPEAVIAVCGCYVQTHPADAQELDVDLIAGTGSRVQFVEELERVVQARTTLQSLVDDVRSRRTFEILPAGGLSSRTRAMLKVEDGCTNFCTYCIIPYARGPVRSEPLSDAVAQTRTLADAGYREIVLTGIELSSWGRDLHTGETLTDLIEAVAGAVPDVRIRLGSLEPRTVTEEFCQRLTALSNLCPQFHLSLQSGCDDTLRRMHRRYTTERYLQSVELLRQFFDRPAITTDLICGFPGETDAEFQQTLDFIRTCGFARMHIFHYSERPGTPAAGMEQVPKAIREKRVREAGTAAALLHRTYLAGCVGQVYPVLYEQPAGDGLFVGHAPNYMEVQAAGDDLHNQIRETRITGTDGQVLFGKIKENA